MEPSAAAQPLSSHPSLMRRLALSTMALARPLAGRRLFPLWAVLEHRGRSTGTVRHTPVVARRTDGGFVIPMPFGPSTQWSQNVLAAGEATLTWKGRAWRVTEPRMIDFDEAAPALGASQRPIAKRTGIDTYLAVRDVQARVAGIEPGP
jgi:deazaflavin-dependent oxidoreductase (nitroreductase family)